MSKRKTASLPTLYFHPIKTLVGKEAYVDIVEPEQQPNVLFYKIQDSKKTNKQVFHGDFTWFQLPKIEDGQLDTSHGEPETGFFKPAEIASMGLERGREDLLGIFLLDDGPTGVDAVNSTQVHQTFTTSKPNATKCGLQKTEIDDLEVGTIYLMILKNNNNEYRPMVYAGQSDPSLARGELSPAAHETSPKSKSKKSSGKGKKGGKNNKSKKYKSKKYN